MLVAEMTEFETSQSQPNSSTTATSVGTVLNPVRAVPFDSNDTRADWLAMFNSMHDANPYQHPDYVMAELETLPKDSLWSPSLLRMGANAVCDGIAILIPKTVRTNQVGGIGPSWELHGFRLAGGCFLTSNDLPAVQEKLLLSVVEYCAMVGAEFLLIEDLDDQSPLHRAIHAQSMSNCRLFAARETQSRWRIALPEKAEDYWKTFSGRTRRAFRTRLKKFGHTNLERVTDTDQVGPFLYAAHEISKQSWQSRQFGLRVRNDASEHRRLTVLAEKGFLRSYVWMVEGEPAAFALCHQHADYFRYEEIAYRAEFSAMSPGETMLQQIVEDLYQHNRPAYFDFGGGDAEYKRRFGNLESHSQTLWLVPATWHANAMLNYLNICRKVRSVVRDVTTKSGLATKARQWLRYGGRSSQAKPTTDARTQAADDAESPPGTEG